MTHPIRQYLYRRASPYCGNVRVMTEELERIEGHSPAMVTTQTGDGKTFTLNIIPSRKWPPDPDTVAVMSHEPLHMTLWAREGDQTSVALDNFPKEPKDLSPLFARAGCFGWDLRAMSKNEKWKEMVEMVSEDDYRW